MKSIAKKTVFALALTAMFSFVFYSFTSNSTQNKPWVIPGKYKAMKNPIAGDKGSIPIGKSLYNKHCKSCHGAKGHGDGPKSLDLKVTPRSFTSKEIKAFKPGELYYMSFIGRDEMPNFEKKIPDTEDRWSIINYIATFK